jgi:hypothetical protein
MHSRVHDCRCRIVLLLGTMCLMGAGPEWDQILPNPDDLVRSTSILPAFDLSTAMNAPVSSSTTRDGRIPLFRTPTGILGMAYDDDTAADDTAAVDQMSDSAFGTDNRLQVDFGVDNPYFDFRPHGLIGGIGYYKVQGEYQLLDSGTTGMSFAFRGITPAGVESDGIANGPTLFTPALSWYQQLVGGSALQGFVGKNLHADYRVADNLSSVQYGVAYQQPLWSPNNDGVGSVHMFVQALGYYRCDDEFTQRNIPSWELLPGLHFRAGDNWWLSGGMIVPVGQARTENGFWQVTCSWRY